MLLFVVKGKEKIAIENHIKVIYKLKYKGYDAYYVGQTKREAILRIKEHKKGIDKIIEKNDPKTVGNIQIMTTRS